MHTLPDIEDAYTDPDFDFSGTRKFDQNTGYRSQSFLTVPMCNQDGDVIGALQLRNAMRPGSPRGATENLQFILKAIHHAVEKIKGDPSECAVQ